MKFAVLALLAVVNAQDEEAAADAAPACGDGEDAAPCEEGQCCGTATPVVEEGEEAGEARTVCNSADAADWADPEDEETTYAFACNDTGDSATSLTVSAAALLSA